jgi:hypothetical protein
MEWEIRKEREEEESEWGEEKCGTSKRKEEMTRKKLKMEKSAKE